MTKSMVGFPAPRTAASDTDLDPKVTMALGLFHETPLLFSPAISDASGCNVWLKLENTQPSGSFKSRGIGQLCHLSSLDHGVETHLVVSSSGNAALAVAHAVRMLRIRGTACVHSGTSLAVRQRLRDRGVEVAVAEGEGWEYADQLARQLVASDRHAVYVPPFDHEEVVRGNAEIVREIKAQWAVNFRRQAVKPDRPDAIICSVGGGGLLGGILQGLKKAEWQDVPVLAVESDKTASLLESLRASWSTRPPRPVQAVLDKLGAGTICHSLGSRWASAATVKRCIAHVPGEVSEVVVPEARIPDAVQRLLSDHHFLVEPACAIALAPLYAPRDAADKRAVIDAAIPNIRHLKRPNIVVILCGGSFASIEAVQAWTESFSGQDLGDFLTFAEGREDLLRWAVPS